MRIFPAVAKDTIEGRAWAGALDRFGRVSNVGAGPKFPAGREIADSRVKRRRPSLRRRYGPLKARVQREFGDGNAPRVTKSVAVKPGLRGLARQGYPRRALGLRRWRRDPDSNLR